MWWILMILVALPLCLADGDDAEAEFAECCDICEHFKDTESIFSQHCGNELHPIMLSKFQKDCHRISTNGTPEQLSVFLTSIKEFCFLKNRKVVIFECPPEPCEIECVSDCDLCEEIRNMAPCVGKLHELMIAKLIKDCRRMSTLCDNGDCTQLNVFWDTLGEVCIEKVGEYTKPACPPCEEETETCDLCDEIAATACGATLNPILLRKIEKDCRRISPLGGEQLKVFWETLGEFCAEAKHIDFGIPECPETCDVCDEIAETACGAALNPILLRKIEKDCRRISPLGGEQLKVFWETLGEFCVEAKHIEFGIPECPECDECALIEETECGASLNPIFLNKVLKDCNRIKKVGGKYYDVFWMTLNEFCMAKAKDFDKPDCDECSECKQILASDCVSSFNPIFQKKIRKDCDRIFPMGGKYYDVFLDTLREFCAAKGYAFEAPEACEELCPEPDPCCIGQCDVCAELRDPESGFGKTCRHLAGSDADLDALVDACGEIFNAGNSDAIATFVNSLASQCYEATGTFFEFCRYEPCAPDPVCVAKELDIIFLVDTSGSIGEPNFELVKSFVGQVIAGFEISETATRMGIISYSSKVVEYVTLGSVNNQADLLTLAEDIPYAGSVTNTHKGINAASEMFLSHGFGGRAKVLIIITDGKSTESQLTYPAMFWFRENHPDTQVMVVGIDNLSTDKVDPAELRAMATGLGDSNVFDVYGFNGLSDAVSTLTTLACVADPSAYVRGPTEIADPDDPSSTISVDCQEVLYMYHIPDPEDRFLDHYGVYELQEDFLCQGTFTYRHTSYDFNMWRDVSNYGPLSGAVGAVWQVTPLACTPGDMFAYMMNDNADPQPLTYDLAFPFATSKFWKDDDGVSGAVTVCF